MDRHSGFVYINYTSKRFWQPYDQYACIWKKTINLPIQNFVSIFSEEWIES